MAKVTRTSKEVATWLLTIGGLIMLASALGVNALTATGSLSAVLNWAVGISAVYIIYTKLMGK